MIKLEIDRVGDDVTRKLGFRVHADYYLEKIESGKREGSSGEYNILVLEGSHF